MRGDGKVVAVVRDVRYDVVVSRVAANLLESPEQILLRAGVDVEVPLLILALIAAGRAPKAPRVAGEDHRVSFFNAVVHHLTAFHNQSDGHAGEGAQRSAALNLRGRNAMKAGERAGKALRIVVAVFERHVDHARAPRGQLRAGQRQPPPADIFAQWTAAQHAEHALELIRRHGGLAGGGVIVDIVGQMRLDIVERARQSRERIHASFLPSVWVHYSGRRAGLSRHSLPDFVGA